MRAPSSQPRYLIQMNEVRAQGSRGTASMWAARLSEAGSAKDAAQREPCYCASVVHRGRQPRIETANFGGAKQAASGQR